MKTYKQLTLEQRYQISPLLKLGFSKTAIATELGVHKSTIGRELGAIFQNAVIVQSTLINLRRGGAKKKLSRALAGTLGEPLKLIYNFSGVLSKLAADACSMANKRLATSGFINIFIVINARVATFTLS